MTIWFTQATVHPRLLSSVSKTEFYCPKNRYKINFLGQDVSMMPSSYLLLYILPVKNIYITVTTLAFLFMIFVAIRK